MQHGNKLVPSTQDDILLAAAVEERFLDLCGTHLRVRGVELVPPVDLDLDMLRWREMRVRHKQGDYRHTESELSSTKEIATWTLQVNAALRNQGPVHITWKEEVGL